MDTHTVTAQESVAVDTLGRRIVARRHRTVEEKIRIVEESLTPGASNAEVARRHGLNANLLFNWRRQYERGLLATRTRRVSGRRLVPIKLLEAKATPAPAPPPPVNGGAPLRVEFPSGVQLHVSNGADAALLSQLLGLLRG
jgi:transposase